MLDYIDYAIDKDTYQGNGDGYHLNGYGQLDGDYALFYKVAKCFTHKVRREDTEDFLHDLLLYLVLPVITSPTIEQTRILSKSLPLSNTLVNIIEVNISMQSHLYLTKETGNMKKVCLDAAARKAYAY